MKNRTGQYRTGRWNRISLALFFEKHEKLMWKIENSYAIFVQKG